MVLSWGIELTGLDIFFVRFGKFDLYETGTDKNLKNIAKRTVILSCISAWVLLKNTQIPF